MSWKRIVRVGVGLAVGIPVIWALSQVFVGRWAAADPPEPLPYFRERLQTFDTVWARLEVPNGQGGLMDMVLRAHGATGRVTLDIEDVARYSWDGERLWRDTRPDLTAEALGPEADAIAAELLGELFAGLPNTTFGLPIEQLSYKPYFGWRVDFPFAWDDGYVVLLGGLGVGAREDDRPDGLSVLSEATGKPVRIEGVPLFLSADVRWNVRLFDDLSNPESLLSRGHTVGKGFDAVWVWDGPPADHALRWHEATTENPLTFEPDGSGGLVTPSGVEVPLVQLPPVACGSAGQVVTAPVALSFRVDEAHVSWPFLPDAAGVCPARLAVGVVHDHRPGNGARTRIQGTVSVRDASVSPPAVLASRPFDELRVGPTPYKTDSVHALDLGVAAFDPAGVELRLDGTLTVQCQASGGTSSVKLGIDRESPPVLRWPDCYPELGIVP